MLFGVLPIVHISLTRVPLVLPFVIITQEIFALGVGFILCTPNVFYRDTQHILEVLLQAWFFLTPIFYSISLLPESATVLGVPIDLHLWMRRINPMASLVASYQDALYWGTPTGFDFFARTLLTCLAVLVIGLRRLLSVQPGLWGGSVKRPTRILLIGLDGVPLDIIQRWADGGYLPTFRRLIDTGAVGHLRSTIRPSGPSWSSIVTGMNPGKTGIYDFLYRREGTYAFPPVNASLRGGTTMWRYLSDAGYRVGVLNIPMSYPVEQVNGFMISGWMTPYRATDYLYPAELAAELEREIGEYRIYPTETFAENRERAF